MRSLQRQALIDQRTVTRLRDGTVADVVAVTRAGRELLDHHRDPAKDVEQVYYDGWVKPAEIWHDATLYRMVRAAERDVDQDGRRVRLVMLDPSPSPRTAPSGGPGRSDGRVRLSLRHPISLLGYPGALTGTAPPFGTFTFTRRP